MDPNQLLELSDNAVECINEFLAPIVTQEYIGWILPLPKRFKSVFVIDYGKDKYWTLLHSDAKKHLSKRQALKSLKFLQKQGWLVPYGTEPFKEFSPQLKLNPKNMLIIAPEKEISSSQVVDLFPEMSMIYDDDVSGITILDDEDRSKQ